MGTEERKAYGKLSKIGKRQYDLDKAIEQQATGGSYVETREKLVNSTHYNKL